MLRDTTNNNPDLATKTFQRRPKEVKTAEAVSELLKNGTARTSGGNGVSDMHCALGRKSGRSASAAAPVHATEDADEQDYVPSGMLRSLRNRRSSVMIPFVSLLEAADHMRNRNISRKQREQRLIAVRKIIYELAAYFAEIDAFELTVEDPGPSPEPVRRRSKAKGSSAAAGGRHTLKGKRGPTGAAAPPAPAQGAHPAVRPTLAACPPPSCSSQQDDGGEPFLAALLHRTPSARGERVTVSEPQEQQLSGHLEQSLGQQASGRQEQSLGQQASGHREQSLRQQASSDRVLHQQQQMSCHSQQSQGQQILGHREQPEDYEVSDHQGESLPPERTSFDAGSPRRSQTARSQPQPLSEQEKEVSLRSSRAGDDEDAPQREHEESAGCMMTPGAQRSRHTSAGPPEEDTMQVSPAPQLARSAYETAMGEGKATGEPAAVEAPSPMAISPSPAVLRRCHFEGSRPALRHAEVSLFCTSQPASLARLEAQTASQQQFQCASLPHDEGAASDAVDPRASPGASALDERAVLRAGSGAATLSAVAARDLHGQTFQRLAAVQEAPSPMAISPSPAVLDRLRLEDQQQVAAEQHPVGSLRCSPPPAGLPFPNLTAMTVSQHERRTSHDESLERGRSETGAGTGVRPVPEFSMSLRATTKVAAEEAAEDTAAAASAGEAARGNDDGVRGRAEGQDQSADAAAAAIRRTPPHADTSPLQQLLRLCGQQPNLEPHELPTMDQLILDLAGQPPGAAAAGARLRKGPIGKQAKPVVKVGEGSYGEAWRLGSARDGMVVKVVPIDGDMIFNGSRQKTSAEMLSETVICKELSRLASGMAAPGLGAATGPLPLNFTAGFVPVAGVAVCQGPYSRAMVEAWEKWDKQHESENDHVGDLPTSQCYWLVAMVNSGKDLEKYDLTSWDQVRSVLLQTAVALAVAEAELAFEHRDLHWGNVLIRPAVEQPDCMGGRITARLLGRNLKVSCAGVVATIIDFTNSRMQASNGSLVFGDLALDPEVFTGPKGEVQFDTYRWMRDVVGDDWSVSCPATNCLWLSYLAEVLRQRFSNGPKKAASLRLTTGEKRQLQDFRKRATNCSSCGDLLEDELFRGLLEVDPN